MYVLSSKNELTGEHSCIMIRPVAEGNAVESEHSWLSQFHNGQLCTEGGREGEREGEREGRREGEREGERCCIGNIVRTGMER